MSIHRPQEIQDRRSIPAIACAACTALLLHGFVVAMKWPAMASFRQTLFQRASWPRVDVDSALLPGRA